MLVPAWFLHLVASLFGAVALVVAVSHLILWREHLKGWAAMPLALRGPRPWKPGAIAVALCWLALVLGGLF